MKALLRVLPILTEEELAEAQNLWREGFDTQEIADQLGKHESVIWNRLEIIKRGATAGEGAGS